MRDRPDFNRLEIELLDEGVPVDAHDVEFGTRRGKRRGGHGPRPRTPYLALPVGDQPPPEPTSRRRKIAIGAALGLVVVVGGSVINGGDSGETASDSTTSPTGAVAQGGGLQPATESSSTVPATSTTMPRELTGGAPVLPSGQPGSLLLKRSNDVYLLDLATGSLELFEEGAKPYVVAVIPGPAGPTVLGGFEDDFWNFVLGPPGTYWRLNQSQPEIGFDLIDAATGLVLRTAPGPWDVDGFFGLAGSTPNGDLLLYGPDGGVWRMNNLDLRLSRYGFGQLRAAQPGGEVWVRCDDAGLCAFEVVTVIGTQRFDLLNTWQMSVSPDGRWVLVRDASAPSAQGGWLILGVADGSVRDVPLSLVEEQGPSGNSIGGTWTADGRYFIGATSGGLQILDAETGDIHSLALPDGYPDFIPLIVLP